MPKEAANVVTGENRAEFMAKRLKLDPAPAPVKTETVEPSGKAEEKPVNDANATETTETKKTEDDPLQKRFDKLTWEREEAKREAEREKAEAAKERDALKKEREARQKAEEEARALKAKYEPPKTEPDPKPKRSQFIEGEAGDVEYEKSLEDWTTDKVNRERDEKEAQARRAKAWNDRVEAVRSKFPDYQEVINTSDLRVSDEMRDAIVDSEIGPELQYYFVKNPDEATRFGQMTVRGMLIAMGKLEAKLTEAPKSDDKGTPKSEAQTPPVSKVEPVAEISKAPAPETPLKGANAPAEPPVNTQGEFVGTYAEWKALRKAKKI